MVNSKLSLLVTIISLLVLDSVHSVWSTGTTNNITVSDNELLNHSGYCVLNDSVIREKDGDGLLIIINDTGDWLVVTNGSNLFVFPSNGSDCEDDVYNPNIVIYAIQTFIYGVTFLLATSIIILHLCLKELQTVPGILTVLFCFFFNVDNVIVFVHNRYQFMHTVNDNGEVCAVFVYTRGILNFLSQFTRLTIHFQFAYLMYNAYRVRSKTSRTDNRLILKYIIFIVSMASIYSVVILTCDLSLARSAFATDNGYCATEFNYGDASVILFTVQLTSTLVMQVAVFVTGMVLYYLVNKRCCEFKSKDARVSLALGSTAGLNTFLFLVVYLPSGDSAIALLSSSIGTLIELSILLIIFLTSMKVKIAIHHIVLTNIRHCSFIEAHLMSS